MLLFFCIFFFFFLGYGSDQYGFRATRIKLNAWPSMFKALYNKTNCSRVTFTCHNIDKNSHDGTYDAFVRNVKHKDTFYGRNIVIPANEHDQLSMLLIYRGFYRKILYPRARSCSCKRRSSSLNKYPLYLRATNAEPLPMNQ